MKLINRKWPIWHKSVTRYGFFESRQILFFYLWLWRFCTIQSGSSKICDNLICQWNVLWGQVMTNAKNNSQEMSGYFAKKISFVFWGLEKSIQFAWTWLSLWCVLSKAGWEGQESDSIFNMYVCDAKYKLPTSVRIADTFFFCFFWPWLLRQFLAIVSNRSRLGRKETLRLRLLRA